MLWTAKFFSHCGIEQRSVLVEGDQVLVYDDVAGHYTTCHNLSQRQIAKIQAAWSKKD